VGYGLDVGGIQIVPEEALAENAVEIGEFLYGPVQGQLENGTVYFLLQDAGDPEDPGVRSLGGGRNDLGGIIDFIPFGA
jgi:hypothetical protein